MKRQVDSEFALTPGIRAFVVFYQTEASEHREKHAHGLKELRRIKALPKKRNYAYRIYEVLRVVPLDNNLEPIKEHI